MVRVVDSADIEKDLIKKGFDAWYNHHFIKIDNPRIKKMCELSWSAGEFNVHFSEEEDNVSPN